MDDPENQPTGVRFDPAIKRRVKEIAKAERRTFGAQVNLILEEWLASRVHAPDTPPGGVSPSRRSPAPVTTRR